MGWRPTTVPERDRVVERRRQRNATQRKLEEREIIGLGFIANKKLAPDHVGLA